ncbi:HNH endonuclease signature motif containing protein [Plantibacter sp. H53]|uniref:HNH endonuclease signature motif containing protein n=1 Tax=Plantibacter sp. H53 TaxID=1827323 RepID=UPI0009EEE4EA|nr:HNH endonuclease signature motif containing protein [Plantibacter sp. H53]
MSQHSHSPNYVKYVLYASEPESREMLIRKTRFDGENGCWNYCGHINEGGYGYIPTYRHGNIFVHRLALHLAKRPVPADRVVDHLCRNPRCVNPAHLDIVTPTENAMRGFGFYAVNARKTHCPQGHEYSEGNIYWTRPRKAGGNPGRSCKTCARNRYLANKAS